MEKVPLYMSSLSISSLCPTMLGISTELLMVYFEMFLDFEKESIFLDNLWEVFLPVY